MTTSPPISTADRDDDPLLRAALNVAAGFQERVVELEAALQAAEATNREQLAENSALHNKMADEYLHRTTHNDNYIMQSFQAYMANSKAWDNEAEDRNFRQMRRAFEASDARATALLEALTDATNLLSTFTGYMDEQGRFVLSEAEALIAKHGATNDQG